MLKLLLLASIILLIIKWLMYHLKLCKKMEVFPGPKPIMFLGNILDFPERQELGNYALGLTEKYKGTTKLQIGPLFALLIADYEHLEFLLSSTEVIDKSSHYKFLDRWLGRGLLTSTGKKWAKSRKTLNNAFKVKNLEEALSTYNQVGDVFIKKMDRYEDKDVDIAPFITRLTLDAICETAMGIKINAQSEPNLKYAAKVRKMGDIFMARAVSPWKFIDFFYRLTADYREEKKATHYMHEFTNEIIRNRKSEYLKEKMVSSANKTFIDLLLQTQTDGNSLTDECIRDEVNTFMFAGHDTTASALCYTIYLLAKHPEAQRIAFEEVNEIRNGNNSESVTYQDINEMKYLEMCIKEAMRLYPPVPAYTRTSDTDFRLPDGRIVPSGVTCLILPSVVHLNPDLFPDPNDFIPERFAPENSARQKAYSYIPFSAGPRNCIGQKLAMVEMKTVLSKLLVSFEILPVEGYEPMLVAEMVLKTVNGVWVHFKRRQ